MNLAELNVKLLGASKEAGNEQTPTDRVRVMASIPTPEGNKLYDLENAELVIYRDAEGNTPVVMITLKGN